MSRLFRIPLLFILKQEMNNVQRDNISNSYKIIKKIELLCDGLLSRIKTHILRIYFIFKI